MHVVVDLLVFRQDRGVGAVTEPQDRLEVGDVHPGRQLSTAVSRLRRTQKTSVPTQRLLTAETHRCKKHGVKSIAATLNT